MFYFVLLFLSLDFLTQDEPAWLSFVIARYLDEEWVEQPVHGEIGEAVAKLYRQSRDEGEILAFSRFQKLVY